MNQLPKHVEDRMKKDPKFALQVYNSIKTPEGRTEFEKKFGKPTKGLN